MTAALCIDFGNNYTKVGMRREQNATSQTLRSEGDLKYDEDHICIPTVAARVVKNGRVSWLFGTEVKLGSKGSEPQVFRNWKPRFFRGEETHLEDGRIRLNGKNDTDAAWDEFTDNQLEKLLVRWPDKEKEIRVVLKNRKSAATSSDEDFDFKEMGRGYFAWLRKFVEPICMLHGIGTTHEIPVRITLPSFGANSANARLTLQTILKETGWSPAGKRPALPEPRRHLFRRSEPRLAATEVGIARELQPDGDDRRFYSLQGTPLVRPRVREVTLQDLLGHDRRPRRLYHRLRDGGLRHGRG